MRVMTLVDNTPRTSDTRTESEHAVALAVGGELDIATTGQFVLAAQHALAGCWHTTLAIDMSRVTFIDAAGIGALVAIRNHARRDHNVIVVSAPSPCVMRMLTLTALADIFGPPSPP
jgi:anti-sigma B factor antagonist